jgi:hypothetical protein
MTTVAVCTIVHDFAHFLDREGLDVYTKRPPSYEGGRMLLNEDYVLFVVEVIFFNDISILLPNIC